MKQEAAATPAPRATGLSRRELAAAGLGLAGGLVGMARAQEFPQRGIKIVAPYAPGGATDLVARILANGLGVSLNQPVIVENKPGAAGNIGAASVARSIPDGSTLLMGAVSVSINQTLYSGLGFDIVKDFRPVSVLVRVPNVLVVSADSPIRNFPDFVAWLKKNPGAINFGSAGVGSLPHLAMETMLDSLGAKAVQVAYRGTGPAATALLAGEVQFLLENLPPLGAFISAGKMRVIAVATPQRLPDFPKVATIGETIPGFEAVSWQCLLAPAATPVATLEKLHAASAAVLRSPDVAERIVRMGAYTVASNPQVSAAFLKSEVEKWGAVVRHLDLKPG